MTYISHFRIVPSHNDPRLKQLSQEEYQNIRTHPERDIKDRSSWRRPAIRLMEWRLCQSLRQPIDLPTRFTLTATHTIKAIGYSANNLRELASTGTSKPGILCVTDGMQLCIAVAIGGEKICDGIPSPGAKVRIFHVYPWNTDAIKKVRHHVDWLRDCCGLTVKAAMHGGAYPGCPSLFSKRRSNQLKSKSMAISLRALFADLNVPLAFDESSELREEKYTPLGVVIRNDHTVQFVTELHQEIDGLNQPNAAIESSAFVESGESELSDWSDETDESDESDEFDDDY